MIPQYLLYQVQPHEHLPGGMRPIVLTVLSPVWQGPHLDLVYPDGWRQTLMGWTAAGRPCRLKVFWTQAPGEGPTVCLAIGGDGGLRLFEGAGGEEQTCLSGSARPLLALADSLIPAMVRAVIGPAPPRAPRFLA